MRNLMIGFGLVLVGCGGVTPMTGDYAITTTLLADTCGMSEDSAEGDSDDFESNIVFNEDGSVVIDGDDSVPCTADGATVTCSISDTQAGEGADYALIQESSIELVWDSNTSFAGSQTMSLDCEGADCTMLEDYGYAFPCSQDWDIVGAMAEDAAAE